MFVTNRFQIRSKETLQCSLGFYFSKVTISFQLALFYNYMFLIKLCLCTGQRRLRAVGLYFICIYCGNSRRNVVFISLRCILLGIEYKTLAPYLIYFFKRPYKYKEYLYYLKTMDTFFIWTIQHIFESELYLNG